MRDWIARKTGAGRRAVLTMLAVIPLAACSGAAGPASADGARASGLASVAAGGGGGTGAAVVAGDDLCKLLGPGDFAAVGVSGAGGPSENNDPPSAYYCVYRGKSSATGGIELDVFRSDTAAESQETFPELFAEFGPDNDTSVTIAGADEAKLSLPATEGSTDPALIGVRKGRLMFGIGIGIPFAEAQATGERLKQLAALVMQRASALGG